jgi:hypothetical protein
MRATVILPDVLSTVSDSFEADAWPVTSIGVVTDVGVVVACAGMSIGAMIMRAKGSNIIALTIFVFIPYSNLEGTGLLLKANTGILWATMPEARYRARLYSDSQFGPYREKDT